MPLARTITLTEIFNDIMSTPCIYMQGSILARTITRTEMISGHRVYAGCHSFVHCSSPHNKVANPTGCRPPLSSARVMADGAICGGAMGPCVSMVSLSHINCVSGWHCAGRCILCLSYAVNDGMIPRYRFPSPMR